MKTLKLNEVNNLMNSNWQHLNLLLKKLALAFLIFTLTRFLFYIFNLHHFENVNPLLFIYGIRFDGVAISYLFLPLIIFELIPTQLREKDWYKKILTTFFYIGNTTGIIFNLIDLAYFDFTFKRTTADFFRMISTGNDFGNMFLHYILDFWYDYILLIALLLLSRFIYRKITNYKTTITPYNFKSYRNQTIILVAFISFLVIGMRGGVQYKPINLVNAGQYAKAQNVAIVLNTPFTILKTLFDENLKPVDYFKKDELAQIYTPETVINSKGKLKRKNVVIIILESFAKEYVGGFNQGKGYTPFLDSLLNDCYVFRNAYSNGQQSIEALPSILAGLPPLMNANYVVSPYTSSKLDALPLILKKKGYNTSFYHGGSNGTMGFNGFVGSIGIDNYYGLNEYPKKAKEKDFDNNWGIFDEPYLQYFANQLNEKKAPFFSTIFTLSSHHPYRIPEKYKNKFPKGVLPLHETVGYTDYALKRFFKTAQQMQWFNNTIFIFTADHSSQSKAPKYNNRFNQFAIPLFIYDPSGNLKGTNNNFFQQIDITPTTLDLLGINDTIISFGNDAFSAKDKYVVSFVNNMYQIAQDGYFLQFDGSNIVGFYDLKTDLLIQHNLANQKLEQSVTNAKFKLQRKLKAIIQQYNNRLIDNNLTYNAK